MNATVFYSILIFLGLVYCVIGVFTSRKGQNQEEFFLSGRKLGIFPVTMTLLATQLGGGTLLGAAEEAYLKGWWVFFYPLGVALGLLCLTSGFGARLRSMNISTIVELFETIYGSKFLRKVASFLSIVAMFFVLIGQGIATQKFFASIGISSPWIFLLFWAVIIFYTAMGGLSAVVWTDIVQTAFFILCFFATFCVSWMNLPESSLVVENITTSSPDVPWVAWLVLPLLFMLIEQDMGQRCFAARSPKTVTWATALSAVILLVCSLFPIFYGNLARSTGVEIPEGASVLMQTVEMTTNPAMTAIFASALLMVVVSTADSLLCSIASNLGFDFSWKWADSKEDKVQWAKVMTFVIGFAAIALSFFFDNVVSMLMLSYELSVGLLFVPVTMAVMSKNPSKLAAKLAMIFGVLGLVTFRFWTPPLAKELCVLALAYLGYFLGQRLKHVVLR